MIFINSVILPYESGVFYVTEYKFEYIPIFLLNKISKWQNYFNCKL